MNHTLLLEEERCRAAAAGGGLVPITFDALNKGSGITLSNGGRTATKVGVGWTNAIAFGTAAKSSGIHTVEFYINLTALGYMMLGIGLLSMSPAASPLSAGQNQAYAYDGKGYHDGLAYTLAPGMTALATGIYLGMKVNFDAGNITFYRNGDAGHVHSWCNGPSSLMVGVYSNNDQVTINGGQSDFQYPILGAGNDGWFE